MSVISVIYKHKTVNIFKVRDTKSDTKFFENEADMKKKSPIHTPGKLVEFKKSRPKKAKAIRSKYSKLYAQAFYEEWLRALSRQLKANASVINRALERAGYIVPIADTDINVRRDPKDSTRMIFTLPPGLIRLKNKTPPRKS
jgi:hypothetical protein